MPFRVRLNCTGVFNSTYLLKVHTVGWVKFTQSHDNVSNANAKTCAVSRCVLFGSVHNIVCDNSCTNNRTDYRNERAITC